MDQVLLFAAFPVLVAVGLLMGLMLAARGHWRDGLSLGLLFWVAAGLLTLGVDGTWTALGIAASIIAIRTIVMWTLASTRSPRA